MLLMDASMSLDPTTPRRLGDLPMPCLVLDRRARGAVSMAGGGVGGSDAPYAVIARSNATKQSTPSGRLDCFAALAMTRPGLLRRHCGERRDDAIRVAGSAALSAT